MSKNPFMDRASQRGNMDHGRKSEKRVATSLAVLSHDAYKMKLQGMVIKSFEGKYFTVEAEGAAK